jgi:hypothetical protein
MKGGSRGPRPGHSGSVRRAPPAYMLPPAFNMRTRPKMKLPTSSTFQVVEPDILTQIKVAPQQGYSKFSSSMGTVYYPPQNN